MARAALVVVLPTPPLPEVITIVLANDSPSYRRMILNLFLMHARLYGGVLIHHLEA
jgi:hypothetical protein